MPKPIEAVLIGAGNRGYHVYGAYSLRHPDEIRFVAVAEPDEARRARFAQTHNIPPEHQFRTWEDMFAQGQIAEVALVCTLDRMHVGPTVAALEAGYQVLLEKPMATTVEDCVQLVQTAERTGRLLQICHVLRYTAFFSKLHEIIQSGRLGDIVTVEHRENVVYWHMAHSFVRGNWGNSQRESPMILAKCCHDMDILFWNLGPVKRLSSFGSLIHFRADQATGPDVPDRCTDGCPVEDDCPFFAPRLYLQDYTGWPTSTIATDLSLASRRHALETGPYGRCVYRCDNDVVDHQTVNMEFASRTTAVLFMHGHSHKEGRTMRYDGTRATLRGEFLYEGGSEIAIYDHLTGRREVIHPDLGPGGHGGGDEGLMAAFIRTLHERHPEALTSARASLESHLMALAAEEARVEGTVLDMDAYRASVSLPAPAGPFGSAQGRP